MSPSASQEEGFAAALAVAVQHPAVSADQYNICKLLQVCKSWRAAVQQSAAGNTAAKLCMYSDPDALPRLANFASWLSKYAHLLCSISIWDEDHREYPQYHRDAYIAVGTPFLQLSLQQLGHLPGEQAHSEMMTSSATVVTGLPAAKSLLALQHYGSNVITSPAVLCMLPAASLTSLSLCFPQTVTPYCSKAEYAQLPQVLGKLSNLRHLVLDSPHKDLPPNSLSGAQWLSNLGNLISLQLLGICHTWQLQQLPDHLQDLHLKFQDYDDSAPAPRQTTLNLHRLTDLVSLELDIRAVDVAPGASLPSQLEDLTVRGGPAIQCFNIPTLKNLQQLSLQGSQHTAEQLRSLTGLTQLQSLALGYGNAIDVFDKQLVWPELLRLRSLHISGSYHMGFQAVIRFLSQLIHLTDLSMSVALFEGPDDFDTSRLQVFQKLSALTGLQQLDVEFEDCEVSVREHDALHVTALRALTSLRIVGVPGISLNDATGSAIALRLTNLQHVTLLGDLTIAVLPAIGMLSELRELHVSCLSQGSAGQGLKFLRGLKKLQSLEGAEDIPAEEMDRFWRAVGC